MPQDLTDDKSTLVQVMAWCRQAPSHYLKQCWPRSPTQYGVTRPQELICAYFYHGRVTIQYPLWGFNCRTITDNCGMRSWGNSDGYYEDIVFLMDVGINVWGTCSLFYKMVQVMAWCRQEPSHYLKQCWPRSPTPYGVTRPQRVNMRILLPW